MSATIRLAAPTDAARIAAIYAPAVSESAISFELEPPDAIEMARRVSRIIARTPWLVFERRGELVGYAYAGPFRDRPAYQWSVEVSAYVEPEAHRGRVATALYTSLFAVLALQGFRRAVAGVALPNPASERLHERLGFLPVGVYHEVGYKLGAWHDVAWFERALSADTSPPRPPRPLPEVRTDPAFVRALATGLGELDAAHPRSTVETR